jgi:hypothetical protein
MKIDEPETPWASPPRELFDDDGASSPRIGRCGCLSRTALLLQRLRRQS